MPGVFPWLSSVYPNYRSLIQAMTNHDSSDTRLVKPAADVWQAAKEILQKKFSEPSYQSWLKDLPMVSLVDRQAVFAVRNVFWRDLISNKFKEAMATALSQILNETISVKIIVDPKAVPSNAYAPTIASISILPAPLSAPIDGDPIYGGNRNYDPDRAKSNLPGQSRSVGSGSGLSNAQGPISNSGQSPSSSAIPGSSHSNTRGSGHSPVDIASPGSAQSAGHVSAVKKSNLNSKYTFLTFVVGNHNRFCHSAAHAVATNPGQAYNPLFLYGGVGLGKTHIMQAIGHDILQLFPNLTVRYMTCERFTNDLINSIRDDRMVDFRKRYRQLDVLLMDDIQNIQGKESTQEEFFHTFEALRDSGRQIVLSSDRPPKDIALLEERLRSRFEWGLITDIQPPDFETRVAILRKKCEVDNIRVPDDLLAHIASLFTTNIRELEGALIRASAYANLTGAELSISSLSNILQPVSSVHLKPNLTLDFIIETVAQHYQIEPSEIRSPKRSHDLTLPRHIAMYLAHDLMQMSFPRIGQAFANRKHTSALYAHSRIKESILSDQNLAAQVTLISRKLTG
jgi:chromosomal replication initiator protein